MEICTDFKTFMSSVDGCTYEDVDVGYCNKDIDIEPTRSTSRGSKGSGDTSSFVSSRTPPSSPNPATQTFVVTPDSRESKQTLRRRSIGSSEHSGGLMLTLESQSHYHHVVTPDNSPKCSKSAQTSMDLEDKPGIVNGSDEAAAQNDPPSPTLPPRDSCLRKCKCQIFAGIAPWLSTQVDFFRQLLTLLFTEISPPQDVVLELNMMPLHNVEAQADNEHHDKQPTLALLKAEKFVLKGFLAVLALTKLVGNSFMFAHCITNNDFLNDCLWAIIIARMIFIVCMCLPSIVDFCDVPKPYDYLEYVYLGVFFRLVMNVALIVFEFVLISIVGNATTYSLVLVLLFLDCIAVLRCLVVRYWKIEDFWVRFYTSISLHGLKLLFALIIVTDLYRNRDSTNIMPGLFCGAMVCCVALKFVFFKADKFKLLMALLYQLSFQGLEYYCGFKQLCELHRV